ncbi:inositol monophosphatase 1-like [Tubulanus polymorphus]|uniref:inositol monophosphatase 1-like n=1 Tax=Tubulanus polymorphus TaxID=672921 RepID=UPI003DA344AA
MFEESYVLAVGMAQECGKMMLAKINGASINTKEHAADAGLVTEVDLKIEKYVKDKIAQYFPDHRFIGEETDGQRTLTDEPTWIVDPIDGTTNFIHGFPEFCISIGFFNRRKAVFGVVFIPKTNSLYTARRGEGAFLNGERIHVSGNKDIKDCLILNEVGCPLSKRPDVFRTKMRNFENLSAVSRGLRCVGSAVVSMCYVARGVADGYVEFGLHCWDVAAGHLIVEESGGIVLGANGEHWIGFDRIPG